MNELTDREKLKDMKIDIDTMRTDNANRQAELLDMSIKVANALREYKQPEEINLPEIETITVNYRIKHDQKYPLELMLKKLIKASDILLRDLDYDGDGWELLHYNHVAAKLVEIDLLPDYPQPRELEYKYKKWNEGNISSRKRKNYSPSYKPIYIDGYEDGFNDARETTTEPVKQDYEKELIPGMPCLVRDDIADKWKKETFAYKNQANEFFDDIGCRWNYAIPFNRKLIGKVQG